jgi:hypothetical protein
MHTCTLLRYVKAVEELEHMGHTQDMLVKLVQAKIQERVRSYAEQAIKVRRMFEYFDLDGGSKQRQYTPGANSYA